MSHNSDGRIYTDSTHGISIADVQAVLGTGRNDIGALCTAPAVFKMAKYKPVRHATLGRITDAQRLALCYGLSIPRYGANDFKTHYSDQWTYLKPRGMGGGSGGANEWYRLLDFDGYMSNYWLLGSTDRNLTTIFDGSLSIPAANVSAGDLIRFDIRCCEDPDTGVPGLLYPYDWLGETTGWDISLYYMGVAILDSQNVLRVITGDQMRDHHTRDDVDATMLVSIPNAVADGALKIIPVLCQNQSPTDPNTGDRLWTNSPQGYLISLDGAYLSATKSSTSASLVSSVAITVQSNRVKLDFTLQNNSSQDMVISKLFGYLLSANSYYNEYEGTPIPCPDPSTELYISQTWPDTPTLTQQHHSTADIMLSDRTGENENPDYLCGYGLNVLGGSTSGFYHANGDSSVLAHGATVTWTQYINHLSDGYGDYSENAFFILGIQISPNITFVRTYIMDE